MVSHSQRILSQRKHHLLIEGESSSPPEELCSSSEELWTNEVEQLLSEETGPNGHGARFPRGVHRDRPMRMNELEYISVIEKNGLD